MKSNCKTAISRIWQIPCFAYSIELVFYFEGNIWLSLKNCIKHFKNFVVSSISPEIIRKPMVFTWFQGEHNTP